MFITKINFNLFVQNYVKEITQLNHTPTIPYFNSKHIYKIYVLKIIHQYYQLTIKPNMLSQFKLMKTIHIDISLFH